MLNFFIPHRQEGEKIILLLRRHPIIIFFKILLWATAAILPLIFYYLLGEILAKMFSPELFTPLLVLFAGIFYLYIWLFMFFSFVDYYLDVWIVTNERIINIEMKGLFSRTASEQKLYRVQDVTSEIKGFFATVFNFGTVYIQTAGEQQRFIFKQIPQPDLVTRKINALVEENKKFHRILEKE